MPLFVPFFAETASATITIDGVTYRVPLIDADGHLQVDVLTSALPSGAATSARQDTMITALQLIDDLRTALASVATDQLRTDVVSSALPSGAATLAEQQTQTTALQLIDDLRTALASVATDQLRTDVFSSALPSGAATLAEQQTQTTALQLIDDLRTALASVATDQLRVDVISSALPSGAATSARQDTMITALQLIDDLRNALDSVQSDRLNVNVFADGASEVKAVRYGTSSDSRTRATVLTPTSGKKVRLVSLQVYTSSTTQHLGEVYFGTGTDITTNPGKDIAWPVLDADPAQWFIIVWPDGGGPVGAADEVLSYRTNIDIAFSDRVLVHYREE